MPLWISEFKRAWQAQFLSYNLETLEKWIFLKGVQIILLPFFHIPAGFRFRKNALKSDVHSLRRPWSTWIMVLLEKCLYYIFFLKLAESNLFQISWSHRITSLQIIKILIISKLWNSWASLTLKLKILFAPNSNWKNAQMLPQKWIKNWS